MKVKSLSGADVARCFGVDRAMVTRWKKAGMPHENGVFDLPLCFKWRLEREADAMALKKSSSEPGDRWLALFRKERARMARLNRQEKQGELLERSAVEHAFTARAYEFARALLILSRRCAAKVAGKAKKTLREVEKILEGEARLIMEAYSRPINLDGRGDE